MSCYTGLSGEIAENIGSMIRDCFNTDKNAPALNPYRIKVEFDEHNLIKKIIWYIYNDYQVPNVLFNARV